MIAPWLIGLLAWTSLLLVPGLAATTLRLEVVDAKGAGVALLRVTVEDADGASHTVITDAAGQAVVGPLPGTIVFVRAAQLAPHQDLVVEPTTATDGLRLGLIPGHERTVRLIAEGGLLFLDPEELFPADAPAAPAPDTAALPTSAPSLALPPASALLPARTSAAPTTATAAVPPMRAHGPSRAFIVGLLAVVASTIVVLLGSIVGRRQA